MRERRLPATSPPDGAAPPMGHVSVLQGASITLLAPAPGTTILDGTFGGGGHTRALLDASAPDGRVLALDADPDAITRGEALRTEYGDRLTLRHANFAAMIEEAAAIGWQTGTVATILLDLGLSSFQLGDAARGFSFMQEGPLDMRFDTMGGLTAAEIVNTWDEIALADLFWAYGEEPASRRVARRIVEQRATRPYETTLHLADTVVGAKGGRRGRIHPATQVFQALRIVVNDEVGVLERALIAARDLLRPGGRLAVIAFHSLEDRAVKRFFRHEASATEPDLLPRSVPVQPAARVPSLRILTPRPVTPTDTEIAANPRARSAKLRVAEKRAPDGGA
ncbi:MAG TPA: 16S rRNA (cytosine(1402)-N(4))-methyltransferase RsmH [Thermomicrobiales bacterium]